MKRKKTGCGCILLMLIMLGLGIYRLTTMEQAGDWTENEDYSGVQRTIAAFCEDHDVNLEDYPEELVELLERNPETEEYVLYYPLEKDREIDVDLSGYDRSAGVPLFLQWDRQWGYMTYGGKPAGLTACGPVCLSMAAWYLTGDDDFSPDKMIEFAGDGGYYSKGNGSSWTLISEGAVELGFDVTEIPLVKQRILDNLEAGNPIICAMGPGDFTTSGHFILLVGQQDGLIRVNDPNSRENSAKLWEFEDIEDQFRNLWVIRKLG